MRKISLLVLGMALATGCVKVTHGVQTIAQGKVLSIGNAEAHLLYVNGIVVNSVTRENTEMTVTTSDSDSALDGIKAGGIRDIRYRTGPVISGYLTELAGVCPEAATAYIKSMPKLNEAQYKDLKQPEFPKETSVIERATKAVKDIISDPVKAAVEAEGWEWHDINDGTQVQICLPESAGGGCYLLTRRDGKLYDLDDEVTDPVAWVKGQLAK